MSLVTFTPIHTHRLPEPRISHLYYVREGVYASRYDVYVDSGEVCDAYHYDQTAHMPFRPHVLSLAVQCYNNRLSLSMWGAHTKIMLGYSGPSCPVGWQVLAIVNGRAWVWDTNLYVYCLDLREITRINDRDPWLWLG